MVKSAGKGENFQRRNHAQKNTSHLVLEGWELVIPCFSTAEELKAQKEIAFCILFKKSGAISGLGDP